MSNARDDLLLELYACPADPPRWTAMLDRLCCETGARSAVIQSFRVERSGLRVERLEQDSHSRQLYGRLPGDVSAEANPRLEMRRLPRGLNRMVRDDDLFDPGEPARLRLHEHLAESGLDRFVGCLHQVGQDVYLALALHRAVDDRHDFSGAQIACLSALIPHVVQAFALDMRLHAGDAAATAFSRLFDRFRCGIILCEADGRVRWANRSADTLLASHGALRRSAGGLFAASAAETRMLLDAIGETALAGPAGADTYLRLGRSGEILHLAMQPFGTPDPGCRGLVLLVLTPAGSEPAIPPDAIVRLFGVTPAEGRLMSAVVGGQTLEQYAQQRGVSVGTVRGQLKQVLAKTGAARQSELVRLVLSSAAAQLVRASASA